MAPPSMDRTSVRAITFDAAHTLFHPKPSVGAIYQEVMARHGLDYDPAELNSGFRRAFASVIKDRNILNGERREHSYWQAVVRESMSGLAPQPKDFDTLFEALWEEFALGHRWRLADGARETLAQLRQRGYATGLLTNWDKRVRQVVRDLDLESSFDHLFISSEIGAEKPDAAIFEFAARTFSCSPHQLLHVGDSLQHDIRGASEAGWQAIRITDEPEHASDDYPHIHNLLELLEFLPTCCS